MHDEPIDFFGGSADHQKAECGGTEVVHSIVGSKDESSSLGKTNGGEECEDKKNISWSHDGLCAAQLADPDIRVVIEFMKRGQGRPEWKEVALLSPGVKALWNQWPRLVIQDGLLKRRFEDAENSSVHWQVVWPAAMRNEFLKLAHGGMTGGHLGRCKTASAVQARAYWPSWSSDLDKFLEQCEPCLLYTSPSPRDGLLYRMPSSA